MKNWNAKLLEQLLKVQATDLKIRKLDQQIHIYYQRSKEEDIELSRIKSEIVNIDDTVVSTENQNQMYLNTLEDIRSAIKGLMTTKAGSPKPRTRSSTEALKIEEEKLESLIEETAEQLLRLRREREDAVARAAERTEELENHSNGPEAEILKLQLEIQELEKQREKEIEGIPSLLLKLYDRLKSSRSGVGLTILRDGVCTVCCMQMPTAIASKLNNGEKIAMCPACGRMVARIEYLKPQTLREPITEKKSAIEPDSEDGTQKRQKKDPSLREADDERKAALKKSLKRSIQKKLADTSTDIDAIVSDDNDFYLLEEETAILSRTEKDKNIKKLEKKALKEQASPKNTTEEADNAKQKREQKKTAKKSVLESDKKNDISLKKASKQVTSKESKKIKKDNPLSSRETNLTLNKARASKTPKKDKIVSSKPSKAAATVMSGKTQKSDRVTKTKSDKPPKGKKIEKEVKVAAKTAKTPKTKKADPAKSAKIAAKKTKNKK